MAETDTAAVSYQAHSGVTPETIRKTLVDELGATRVDIEDMSGGCGQMYAAQIVSAAFAKKGTLARHRLVNAALKEQIKAIHAWTPKCYTPEEWEERK